MSKPVRITDMTDKNKEDIILLYIGFVVLILLTVPIYLYYRYKINGSFALIPVVHYVIVFVVFSLQLLVFLKLRLSIMQREPAFVRATMIDYESFISKLDRTGLKYTLNILLDRLNGGWDNKLYLFDIAIMGVQVHMIVKKNKFETISVRLTFKSDIIPEHLTSVLVYINSLKLFDR